MSESDTPQRPPARPSATTPAVFGLAQQVWRGMQAAYAMIAREANASLDNAALLEALTELLIQKGVIERTELVAQREVATRRLVEEVSRSWTGPWITNCTPEEQARPDVQLDCETRHPQCAAACCTLYNVILTPDEVRSGELLWDLARPYALPRDALGRCTYLERGTLKCTVWATRPQVCRQYSCEKDAEVWQDFTQVIPTERVRALSRAAAEARR